ncbi:hypothetical protein [Bradyrhizobium ontarionense]|nr:hypothetical protein [Bradyrhizobium sp. A19]
MKRIVIRVIAAIAAAAMIWHALPSQSNSGMVKPSIIVGGAA